MAREDYLRRRAAAKRAAILAAARARFAEEGLDGASVERIAGDAAVSTATLYRLFPSKVMLFEAVLEDGIATFERALADRSHASPGRRLADLTLAYSHLLDDPINAGIVRAVLSAAPRSSEAVAAFYEKVKIVIAGAFHEAVRRAVAEGELAPPRDPRAPGALLMGMVEHAVLWRRLLSGAAGDVSSEEIAATALEALWAAFGASGSGRRD